MEKQFKISQIGQKARVLIEKQLKNGVFEGWSDNYIRLNLHGDNIKLGKFYNWIIE